MRLRLLCFLVVCFAFLAGCGGGSPTSPASTPPSVPVESKAKKAGTNIVKDEIPTR